MNRRSIAAILAMAFTFPSASIAYSQEKSKKLDTFETVPICSEYYSEGAAAGDFNNDGIQDIVYGPHWYAGPDFKKSFEIYPPKPQNREFYSDHFFAWVYDFDHDGWNDIFTVGFPGTPAYVYQNPGKGAVENGTAHWKKHEVFDSVSNESPQLIQLVGDERPELVCTRDGFFGYATIDWDKPFSTWKFTAISAQLADKKFGHGLGIGDVDGDGRMDVIHSGGWLQQPKDLTDAKPWRLREAKLTTAYGGAEMYAYDVDGDGDNDIITSNAAHDFGLAWYEQTRDGDDINFKRHEIMGSKPEHNSYGVVFSELHSVNLADIDGDGLKDIVTGKTYYSHHKQSPMWDTGAVLYWFKLVRNADGVDWIPYKAADDAGVGRQLGVFDLNKDGLPDFVVGGMKGAHAIVHSRKGVDETTWKAAQPNRYQAKPKIKDQTTIYEGESLRVLSVTDGSASEQGMAGFGADRWSGDSQLWWTGGKVGSRLQLEFIVAQGGNYEFKAAFTQAPDYAIVQPFVDGIAIGKQWDLYSKTGVNSTGTVSLGKVNLAEGNHRIEFVIVDTNPDSTPAFMFGLDRIELELIK